jgi:hypothetical protein
MVKRKKIDDHGTHCDYFSLKPGWEGVCSMLSSLSVVLSLLTCSDDTSEQWFRECIWDTAKEGLLLDLGQWTASIEETLMRCRLEKFDVRLLYSLRKAKSLCGQ